MNRKLRNLHSNYQGGLLHNYYGWKTWYCVFRQKKGQGMLEISIRRASFKKFLIFFIEERYYKFKQIKIYIDKHY